MTSPANMPDDDLDAAVAIEVMGWERRRIIGGDTTAQYGWDTADGNYIGMHWSPANDIATAMNDVVPEMRRCGYRVSIYGGTTDTPWIAQFIDDDTGECYYGPGPSYEKLSRAITEAALMAARTESRETADPGAPFLIDDLNDTDSSTRG